MPETNEVFNHLSPEQVGKAVPERQLPAQTSYTQQEIDLFPQEHSSVDGNSTSPPAQINDPAHEQLKPIDSLGLLTLVSGQLGSSISLTEAGKILDACGLPDSQAYNAEQCDRFAEACTLVKQQGKTLEEIAAHFGVTPIDEPGERDNLVKEVHGLLSQVSATQVEIIRKAVPKMAAMQLQEIKSLFHLMTARRLQQYVTSGQLEAQIRTASENILATAGKYLGLLRSSSSPNLKSLRG